MLVNNVGYKQVNNFGYQVGQYNVGYKVWLIMLVIKLVNNVSYKVGQYNVGYEVG